jgi:tetratricopeptide (TPR) repeat protein
MAVERFIVVDDADQNLLFFQVLLKEIGIENCVTSTNSVEALELIDTQHIQFVICAWEMGPMPGTVFVQKARAKKNRKYMPCLIYSKRMAEGDVNLTRELGFNSILSMPFDRDAAKKQIQDMIKAEENIDPLEKQLRKIEYNLIDNRPSEALKLVDGKVLKKGVYFARAQTMVADIWLRLMKYDKAETHLKDALEDSPEYFPALQLKCQLLKKLNRHAEAIEILVLMSKKSPNNITTLVNLGCAYVDTKQYDKAKETFDQVKSIDSSKNEELVEGQAKLAFAKGDMNLASQLVAELESGDEMARYFNNMAISMVVMGECDKGIATYQNAMKVLADRAKLHLLQYNLGLALKKKGDLQGSLQEFCNSYFTEPKYDKAYSAAARIVRDLRQKGAKFDKKLVDKLKETRQVSVAKSDPSPTQKKSA